MQTGNDKWSIVFNGEIYNTDALRAPLLAQGIRFRGHSDTEVLIESFAAFGVQITLERTIGMFTLVAHECPGCD